MTDNTNLDNENIEYSKIIEELQQTKHEFVENKDPKSIANITRVTDVKEIEITRTNSILNKSSFEGLEISEAVSDNELNTISKEKDGGLKTEPSSMEEPLDTNEYIPIEDFPREEDKETIESYFNEVITPLLNNEQLKNLIISLNKIDLRNRNPTKNAVCELSKVERMIEDTYDNKKEHKFDIAEQICYLKFVSVYWRKIMGDGNCFYRSVMFRYLESLVFEKNVLLLKNIANRISIWFNASYKKTASLPNKIKDSFVNLDLKLIYQIIQYLITLLTKQDVLEAYKVLIKSFLYSTTFDIGMVLYLRYEIYEFLSSHEKKCFTKEFPVLLGNLLPSQYERDDGTFKFTEFYHDELLKFATYAEKLVIYITPIVLKRNLKLIIYDYGKDCNIQTKEFKCYLPSKDDLPNLEVLYRKCHYDVIYSQEYFNIYCKYLQCFAYENEKLRVVDENLINYYLNNAVDLVDGRQSKIFDKKQKRLGVKTETEKKKDCPLNSNNQQEGTNSVSNNSTKMGCEKQSNNNNTSNNNNNSNTNSNSNTNNNSNKVASQAPNQVNIAKNDSRSNTNSSENQKPNETKLLDNHEIHNNKTIDAINPSNNKESSNNSNQMKNHSQSQTKTTEELKTDPQENIKSNINSIVDLENSKKQISSEIENLKSKLNSFIAKCGLCTSEFSLESSIHKQFCNNCLSGYYLKSLNSKLKDTDIQVLQTKGISITNIKKLAKCFCSICGIMLKEKKGSKLILNPFCCACSFCTVDCYKNAVNSFSNQLKNLVSTKSVFLEESVVCRCGCKLTVKNLIEICHKQPEESIEIKKTILGKLDGIIIRQCMFCSKATDLKKVQVDDILKVFDKTSIDHYLCPECFAMPFYLLICNICQDYHYKDNQKK